MQPIQAQKAKTQEFKELQARNAASLIEQKDKYESEMRSQRESNEAALKKLEEERDAALKEVRGAEAKYGTLEKQLSEGGSKAKDLQAKIKKVSPCPRCQSTHSCC